MIDGMKTANDTYGRSEDVDGGWWIMDEKEICKQLNKIMGRFCNHTADDCYLVYLVGVIGATLAGVKPAELLNIPIGGARVNQADWEEFRGCLLQYKKLKLREINKQNGRKQVFFYHQISLDNVLSEEANLKFLRGRGYPERYSIEDYVAFLVERLRGDDFPHEIGIFLGYPLKDVLGFVGCSSLRLVRRKGWNFFGDEEISNKRYESFLQARLCVKKLIEKRELTNQHC